MCDETDMRRRPLSDGTAAACSGCSEQEAAEFIGNAPRGSKPPAIAWRVCCAALGCVAVRCHPLPLT